MQAVEGEQRHFVDDLGRGGKPVKRLGNRGDMFMFTHSHQDPGSTVLNIL